MSRRITVVAFAVVVAALLTGFVGVPDSSGGMPIQWKVVGTIVYTQFDIPPASPAGSMDFVPGVMIDIFAKGAPGNAQIKVVAIANEVVDDPNDECGVFPKLLIAEADLVATFADQSMLFATFDREKGGYLCLEPPPLHDENNMIITGGTGRFEGASGSFVGRFLSQPVGASGALVTEYGTIEGWIQRAEE